MPAKRYSDCLKECSVSTAGIKCARRYGLNVIPGTKTPEDGNCVILMGEDQIKMRFIFLQNYQKVNIIF
jgi:hypothetical protein